MVGLTVPRGGPETRLVLAMLWSSAGGGLSPRAVTTSSNSLNTVVLNEAVIQKESNAIALRNNPIRDTRCILKRDGLKTSG